MYRYHVEGETTLPDPGYTPYYDVKFFKLIKDVKEKTPLNPLYMSVKEWYKLLLEKYVTIREIDDEGRMELIPCKVEEREPEVFWSESFRISRLQGLSPQNKSFLFRLIHTLLPSKERVHHLTPTTSPLCWCGTGDQEDYRHMFFQCLKNLDAGQALLRCIRSYDRAATEVRSLRLELQADDPFLLPSATILAIGLELIWDNRKLKKTTTLFDMRSELELAVSIRRRSRSKYIRESADIMENIVTIFFE